MRDWILGLQKAAAERREGLDPQRWASIEAQAGMSVPPELKDLYEAMNGGRFHPDVQLIAFRSDGEGPGVLEQSASSGSQLPERGVWLFGVRDAGQQLFAVRKQDLAGSTAAVPDWVEGVAEDHWVYGFSKSTGELSFYRTLEQLMARLVPPAQTEDFGENTYVRALTAVQGALDSLEVDVTPINTAGATKAKPRAKAKPAAKAKPKPKAKKAKAAAKTKAKAKPKKAKASARKKPAAKSGRAKVKAGKKKAKR
jgi:hypothetical protein